MGLPQLETCCWVLDLKTGNIVLGCLNAALSFILMVVMIVEACTLEVIRDDPLVEELVVIEAAETGAYVLSVILVFLFLAKLCFDIFFVYGVIVERAAIIKAYFIMWIVFFILSVSTFSFNSPNYKAGTICMELMYIGINIYAILLSHSFYKLLNTREEV